MFKTENSFQLFLHYGTVCIMDVTLPFIWTKIGFQMEVEVECASKMLKKLSSSSLGFGTGPVLAVSEQVI